jgi:flagellar biosynthesis GTPase FlhF
MFIHGVGVHVFYLGIYSSAISISEDSELRKAIRRTAVKELKLLDTIGTAQVDTQLQDKVAKLVKEYSDKMNSEVGVQVDLSEHEAKLY